MTILTSKDFSATIARTESRDKTRIYYFGKVWAPKMPTHLFPIYITKGYTREEDAKKDIGEWIRGQISNSLEFTIKKSGIEGIRFVLDKEGNIDVYNENYSENLLYTFTPESLNQFLGFCVQIAGVLGENKSLIGQLIVDFSQL